MRKRRKAALVVHLIWAVAVAVAGIAIGETIALLWVGGLTPEWIEATGTWFGAVAIVLALLWAVQTFRADQAHREEERRRVETDREAALEAEERHIRTDADRVGLVLRGGAGQGSAGEQELTSVRIAVHNDTDRPVVVEEFTLDPPLALRPPATPIRIMPRECWDELLEVVPVPTTGGELSGRPLKNYGGVISFEVHGRRWTRANTYVHADPA
ncbi:hypothetical protein ITJ66_12420 [Plantibacter sp. VKM Ac-2885]|uniref:hypothetical protein n=1 Tax=Plantibacter sp. VKM Ac-2885 TaxID=2783828 RepID=UPI00188D6853|nr:hypothetical protein [Plantibacter sp. VKM Ac-2885]MBF4513286.1 hypothetical protein [Plantibacter sp. VKM Ac-2885]